MFFGHLGAGLLIVFFAKVFGINLSFSEAFFVILNSYILDWDLFLPTKRGTAHHHVLPTHTPFFAIIVLFVELVLIKLFLSSIIGMDLHKVFLYGSALIIHLVLDDISYWLKESPIPQILWFFPFDKRREYVIKEIDEKYVGLTRKQTLTLYLKCKKTILLEFVILFSGIVSFLVTA